MTDAPRIPIPESCPRCKGDVTTSEKVFPGGLAVRCRSCKIMAVPGAEPRDWIDENTPGLALRLRVLNDEIMRHYAMVHSDDRQWQVFGGGW